MHIGINDSNRVGPLNIIKLEVDPPALQQGACEIQSLLSKGIIRDRTDHPEQLDALAIGALHGVTCVHLLDSNIACKENKDQNRNKAQPFHDFLKNIMLLNSPAK
jgi:hypothetical protein